MAHPSVREKTRPSPVKTENKREKKDSNVSAGIGFDQGIPTVDVKRKNNPDSPENASIRVHPAAQNGRYVQATRAEDAKDYEEHRTAKQAQQDVQYHAQTEPRFQHELQEMRKTDDLREVDDDVEDVATLFEWRAHEHTHRPKTMKWFAGLAASLTVVTVGMALLGNVMGALTIALVGGLVYYVAQREPEVFRYRLMTEGVAFNDTLYHYRDLEVFNVIYEVGGTKTVLLRSKRTFAPLLHMEIGEADPVVLRDILIEFVEEDQDLAEPLIDIIAQRLGF